LRFFNFPFLSGSPGEMRTLILDSISHKIAFLQTTTFQGRSTQLIENWKLNFFQFSVGWKFEVLWSALVSFWRGNSECCQIYFSLRRAKNFFFSNFGVSRGFLLSPLHSFPNNPNIVSGTLIYFSRSFQHAIVKLIKRQGSKVIAKINWYFMKILQYSRSLTFWAAISSPDHLPACFLALHTSTRQDLSNELS
jgi:hypothetical protein